MKIAINVNELALEQNRGVKTYTREIVNALKQADEKNEYLLYLNCKNEPLSRFCGFDCKNFKLKISKTKLPFWTYVGFPREIRKDKPDILFMPIQAMPFLKKLENIKTVVMVHDLAFLLFPKCFTFKDRFLLDFHTKRAVEMADKIIAPSETTKEDIMRFYGINRDKIKVIYHGVNINSDKRQTADNKQDSKKDVNILFVGTVQPRKNLVGLIEAFEILNTKYQIPNTKLVIAGGKGWMVEEIYKKAKESEFSGDIIFKGSVSDDELIDLYKNASVFVLPSLYEGFGLPVLEAMSYGVPCVVSDNSSLSEISGNGALLVDAYDSNDIAEKISVLLNDEELREKLSEKGIKNAERFNWTKAAEKTLRIFENV